MAEPLRASLDPARPALATLGSRASLDASLVYTDYRAPRAASLAGAAAFAACVEGGIRLRLRWDGGLPR